MEPAMSVRGLLLTNQQRLLAEEVSQAELVGATSTPRDMLIQQVATLPVGVLPEPVVALADLKVDGSGAAVEVDIAPSDPDIYRIERLRFLIRSATAMTFTELADLGALATGITIKVHGLNQADPPTLVERYDLLGGDTIQALEDFALHGTVEVLEHGAEFLAVADIVPAAPIRLKAGTAGDTGDLLRFTVADDLTGLARFTVAAIGHRENVRR
jgi:hypothetical protein